MNNSIYKMNWIIMTVVAYIRVGNSLMQELDINAWWGPLELVDLNNTSIRPFDVIFDDGMIKYLKYRIRKQREVTPPLEGIAFEYGFNSNNLHSWLQYWAKEYPFKMKEQFFNQFPQFKTNIQGLDIHFVMVKPKIYPGQEVIPLLLLHGWPSSIIDFYKMIPRLTAANQNRNFAVEVIAPHLPGFGYSDAAIRPGLGPTEMAVVLRNLMTRLGYKKFYIHGGDWGAYIGQCIATLFPEEVLGYHTNLGIAFTSRALTLTLLGAMNPSIVVEPQLADRMYPLTTHLSRFVSGMGYFWIQATKPDSLGIALSDSPAGLLAYLTQIISLGTRRNNIRHEDGGLDVYYTREQIIDLIMTYYVPNSFGSSIRIYAEFVNTFSAALPVLEKPTLVPTCVIQAKDEMIYQSPLILRTKFPNLLNVTVLNDGGHFLALEMPDLLADDILNAIRNIKNWYSVNLADKYLNKFMTKTGLTILPEYEYD